MNDVKKLYAAYKAGYLGNNILDTYFSFIANMILEESIHVIEDIDIVDKFEKRYGINLPLPFIRQILGVGVQNNCFVDDHGKYSILIENLSNYKFDASDFNLLWDKLIFDFQLYCNQIEVNIIEKDIETFILDILDDSDNNILSREEFNVSDGMKPEEYAWYSFVKTQAENNSELYRFIAAVSASNITMQALFYTGDSFPNYSGLNIYLDSPIIFALLGMYDGARANSYKSLLTDMIQAGCNVQILDNNFQEVDGIISRAAAWATSTQYDIRLANNAARFFHDNQMSESEIAEFCESIESKLNELGITIKETSYDVYEYDFQEDETVLFEMIKEKYSEQNRHLSSEQEQSIQVDVRSIVMIYRERQGQTSTQIGSAKHLMLTSNNAVANVSKKYESNRSINAGHIPACISADLFGAILWLNSPIQMIEYQKQKLLADCYSFLRPSATLLDKYIQSLDEARKADQLDEKKFLFLRTHPVVLDSLMSITKGDYARFNSNTYLEVYDDIQAQALKKYDDEVIAHKHTQELLVDAKVQAANEKQKSQTVINELENQIELLQTKERDRVQNIFRKKVSILGWIFTILLFGIPYILLNAGIEIAKAQFTDISWYSIIQISGLIVSSLIVAILFQKGKHWCFTRIEVSLKKHQEKKKKDV